MFQSILNANSHLTQLDLTLGSKILSACSIKGKAREKPDVHLDQQS
jgi:hypothetical protein